MSNDTYAIFAAILIAGWMIAQAIDRGFKGLGARMSFNLEQIERIGNKLDNLWSPLSGISRSLAPRDEDDLN